MTSNSSIRPDFAPNVEDQWQMGCSNVGQSMAQFFMNNLYADVYFIPLQNASRPPKKFPGHKVVLAGRSTVLSAHFHYDNKGKKLMNTNAKENEHVGDPTRKKPKNEPTPGESEIIQEIELPDVEPDIFEEFLRFCYTDKVDINAENALSILIIACRYSVPTLEKLATDFIVVNINFGNAFETFQFATQFDFKGYKRIAELSLWYIRTSAKRAVQTEAFFRASVKTLKLFASQENLEMTELELFEALIEWAKRQQMLSENRGKTIRELLGPALFRVQFWQMPVRDFGRVVVPAKVLTDPEVVYVFRKGTSDDHFSSTFYTDPECPFPVIGTRRGTRVFILNIPNVREREKNLNFESEGVFIRDHFFRVSTEVRTISRSKKDLGFFVRCTGQYADWSCKVLVQMTLICASESSWGYRRFIPLSELLRPENGWIDGETVTLRAQLKILEGADSEPKIGEAMDDGDLGRYWKDNTH